MRYGACERNFAIRLGLEKILTNSASNPPKKISDLNYVLFGVNMKKKYLSKSLIVQNLSFYTSTGV